MDDYYTFFTFSPLFTLNDRTIGLATFTKPRPNYPETAIVKIIPSVKRSYQEVETLLRYHNFRTIVQIYAYYRTKNHVVIFLEHCENGSLDKYMETLYQEKVILPEPTAIEMMINITNALSQLHAHDTVHRDIKPHNIFVTRDCTCKLGDLETLKRISDVNMRRFQSKIVGTVEYMAPEKRAKFDGGPAMSPTANFEAYQEDVWAMGKTFFELCKGLIEVNSTFLQSKSFHLRDLVFSQLGHRGYSDQLAELIYRVLSFKMEMTCEAVLKELQRIGGKPNLKNVKSDPSPPMPKAAPPQKRCDNQRLGQLCQEPLYKLPMCEHSYFGRCLEQFFGHCRNSQNVRFIEEIGCLSDLTPIPAAFLRTLSFLTPPIQAFIAMLEDLSREERCSCNAHTYPVVMRNVAREPYLYRCPGKMKEFCSWCKKENGHKRRFRKDQKCKEFPYYNELSRLEGLRFRS